MRLQRQPNKTPHPRLAPLNINATRTEVAQHKLLIEEWRVRVVLPGADLRLVLVRVRLGEHDRGLAEVLAREWACGEERVIARLEGDRGGQVPPGGVAPDDEALLEVDLELRCVLGYLCGCCQWGGRVRRG